MKNAAKKKKAARQEGKKSPNISMTWGGRAPRRQRACYRAEGGKGEKKRKETAEGRVDGYTVQGAETYHKAEKGRTGGNKICIGEGVMAKVLHKIQAAENWEKGVRFGTRHTQVG